MDKRELRQIAIRARGALTPKERAESGRAICERLRAMEEIKSAQVFFSYLAMPEEADLGELHRWLRARGKTLAFPVTGDGGAMEAWAPEESLRFTRDRFGILMPEKDAASRIDPAEIDLILTPCVAFDGDCRRLGHGGGYYDRYFRRCPQALRFCIAFEAQRLPAIQAEPWDVSMDAVVTEAGIYRPK